MSESPKKYPSLLSRIAVTLTAAVVVVGATWSVRHPNDATRGPASAMTPPLRADVLKKSRIDTHSQAHLDGELHGKVTGTFSVEIAGEPGPNPGELQLRGTLKAERAVVGHEFSWILPEGYRIADGQVVGAVPDLAAGETHELQLLLKREASNPKPIVLHVFKIVDSEPRGQVAQFDEATPTELKELKSGQNRKAPEPFLRGQTVIQ